MRENTGGGSPSPPPPTEERAGERRRSLKIPSPWPSPRAPLAGRGNSCLRGRTIFSTKQQPYPRELGAVPRHEFTSSPKRADSAVRAPGASRWFGQHALKMHPVHIGITFLLLNPHRLRQAQGHSMRILIATVTAGAGHVAAAAALEEAWRALRPADTVERVDLIQFFSPLHKKIYADGYVQLVERAPELWGLLFSKTDSLKVIRRLGKLSRAFPSNSRKKFTHHLIQFKPDAVLCTHFTPLDALGLLRQKTEAAVCDRRTSSASGVATLTERRYNPPFVVSVVTDFEAHALWMNPCVDLYCVAAEETKARLVARGAAADNVVATGIPIAAKFSSRIDSRAVRRT